MTKLREAGRFGVALRTTDSKPETAHLLGVGFALDNDVAYVPSFPATGSTTTWTTPPRPCCRCSPIQT